MNKPKATFLIFTFLLIAFFGLTFSFAQSSDLKPAPQAEPSYEVVLQILIASNGASSDNKSVPQTLSNVVRKLKTTYSYSDYRLASTFLERVSNTVEHKSIFSEYGQNQSTTNPVFSDWTLSGLRSLPNARGQNVVQFQSFRFGARIPIVVANRDEGGKTFPVINYEAIGLTLNRLSVMENEPTIIGSLSTSKANELMFLVLTVKPTD
jgi:LysM repeat protein